MVTCLNPNGLDAGLAILYTPSSHQKQAHYATALHPHNSTTVSHGFYQPYAHLDPCYEGARRLYSRNVI